VYEITLTSKGRVARHRFSYSTGSVSSTPCRSILSPSTLKIVEYPVKPEVVTITFCIKKREMQNLVALLNKDLNERRGCEVCFRAPSSHVIFISPKNKGGGCCGVFHICPQCMETPLDFGEYEYQFVKKLV